MNYGIVILFELSDVARVTGEEHLENGVACDFKHYHTTLPEPKKKIWCLLAVDSCSKFQEIPLSAFINDSSFSSKSIAFALGHLFIRRWNRIQGRFSKCWLWQGENRTHCTTLMQTLLRTQRGTKIIQCALLSTWKKFFKTHLLWKNYKNVTKIYNCSIYIIRPSSVSLVELVEAVC